MQKATSNKAHFRQHRTSSDYFSFQLFIDLKCASCGPEGLPNRLRGRGSCSLRPARVGVLLTALFLAPILEFVGLAVLDLPVLDAMNERTSPGTMGRKQGFRPPALPLQ